MNEKTCGIVLGIVNIVLLVICGVFFWGKDKNAPEILLSDVDFVYAAEAKEEILFQGVTAIDKEDGELTDSVVIEKIVTDMEKETATITYGVADSAGNVGKATCTVTMEVPEMENELSGEEVESDQEEDSAETDLENEASVEDSEAGDEGDEEPAEDADENEEEAGNEEEADSQADSDENTEDADSEEDDDESADSEEQEGEALPTAGEAANRTKTVSSKQNPGRPSIAFRSQEIKTKSGQTPAWVNVIEGLHDDKDNYEALLKTLSVKGDYDKNKAGTYNVTVTVTDGEGNESNAYPMKIVVEAWE